ncbi:hypothetical protein [Hylemonella gracilis]|nr:hypothetical protein [Hylemonella gracilis]
MPSFPVSRKVPTTGALLALGALCALLIGPAQAQQSPAATPAPAAAPPGSVAPAGNMSGFLEKLRMKVEQLTPQKQVSTSTAVGGVRGSAVAAADVYWKGEAKPQTIDAAELEAFQKGVALAESDQKVQARAVFAEFAKTYPESILKADAEEFMRHLAEQAAAQ